MAVYFNPLASVSGWVASWGSSGTWALVSPGVLRYTSAGTLFPDSSFLWTEIGTSSETEIVARMRRTSGGPWYGVVVRAKQGTTGDDEIAVSAYIRSNNTLRLAQHAGSSAFNVTTSVAFTNGLNAWYWIRLRVSGADLYAKAWADGSSEPADWMLTATSLSPLAANYAGFAVEPGAASQIVEVSEVGVATFGETAPADFVPFAFSGSLTASGTLDGYFDLPLAPWASCGNVGPSVWGACGSVAANTFSASDTPGSTVFTPCGTVEG